MEPTADDTPSGVLRLLLVEDHQLLAGTLAIALRHQGLEVETAAGPSPDAVVERAGRMAPVLVLLDLDLGPPLGNGLALIRPLIEAGAQVVVVTGVTDRARLGRCLEEGASGVISKATEFETLVDAVRGAAEGRPILGASVRQELLADARNRRRADQERLAPFRSLSRREQAVLAGLVAGDSAETIAARSYVSLATVRTQIRAVLLKLGVNSQLAAVAMAREKGWSPEP